MKKRINRLSVDQISTLIIKNKIVLILLFCIFLLRFPTLFEPLLNDQETYIVTYAADWLLKEAELTLFNLPLVLFVKLAFVLFGEAFWSVKFLLLIYFSLGLLLIHQLLARTVPRHLAILTSFLFVLVLGLPYLGTNQLNSTLILPIFVLLVISLGERYKLPGSKKKSYILLLPILSAIFLFFTSYNSLITPSYYPNFIKYTFSKLSNDPKAEERYFASFGFEVKQSYSLAFFIKQKTSTSDTIFVVGKENAIYFLANRKSASKNILVSEKQNIDQTLTDIETTKPAYILYDKNLGQFGELDRLLNKSYNLFAQENDVKIYSRKPS